MNPGRILALVRAAFCAAIMASAILENDYRHMGDPAFCGVASPCFKLRTSKEGMRFAIWLAQYNLTLPQVALLGFVVLMAVSFYLKSRTYLQGFAVLTTFAGAAALYLIVVQARIHTFCPYCMVVDTSTLIAAAATLVLLRVLPTEKLLEDSLKPTFGAAVTFAWGLAAAVATVMPYVWASYPSVPALPKPIADMQVPGKLTIISITDFQCPFCRKTAPILTELHARPDVAFKRVMAPLTFHPGAEPAARAYLCVPEAKANDFAEALYTDPDMELTEEWAGLPAEQSHKHYADVALDAASKLGLDADAMSKCMSSDETSANLEKDEAIFQSAGGEGLPTTFIGKLDIVGYDPPKLKAAADAHGVPPFELPLPLLFVVVGGAAAAAFAFTWKRTDRGRGDTLEGT